MQDYIIGKAAWSKAMVCISQARTHKQTLMACQLAGVCPHTTEGALAVPLLWEATSGLTALMGTVLVGPPTKTNLPVELAVRMLHEMACMPGTGLPWTTGLSDMKMPVCLY